MNNIFITGINSGCGKTVISAGIAAVMQSLGYNTGVYKPIQLGAIDKSKYLISPDLAFVKMLDQNIKTHSTYMFKEKTLPIVNGDNIYLQDISRDYEILSNQTKTVLVDFWAEWCAPCKMMNPKIEKLSETHPEIIIGKVNVDEEKELASHYGIMSIPALVLFKDGKAVDSMVGFRPKESILAMLDK